MNQAVNSITEQPINKPMIALTRFHRERRTKRQHIIAELRGKVACTRREIEHDDHLEEAVFQAIYANLLEQLTLLDELEAMN